VLSHPILDKHDIIAWDMDGTLIDGVNSKQFIAYINQHFRKKHYVITFRDAVWGATVELELEEAGLRPGRIEKVICNPTGRSTAGFEVRDFKGQAAKGVGATILVDDMPNSVEAGCIKAGVEYLDARLLSSRPKNKND
jgi:hypothetical protein